MIFFRAVVNSSLERCVPTTYHADDFDLKKLRAHLEHDIKILERILSLVEPIRPEQVTKLQTLIKRFGQEPLRSGKLETPYADDGDYVFASTKRKGKQPYWMSKIMQVYISLSLRSSAFR